MKKVAILLLTLLLLTTTYCVSPNNYFVASSETVELHHPTETPLITETELPNTSDGEPIIAPTTTLTPTNTPAFEEEPNPYIFISEYKMVDLSIGQVTITLHFPKEVLVNKREKGISAYLVSPKNLGVFSNTSEALTLGNGTGVIRPEKYGNLIVSLHSGYYLNKPLEAEVLRVFLENWGKHNSTYVQKKLEEIEGKKGVLSVDNIDLNVKILGGVRLQNQEAKEVGDNPTDVLDIITKRDGTGTGYLALGNTEIFESLKKGDGHEILLSFCGWEIHNQETSYSYYRYVILLEVEEFETPEYIK